jgi:hypothetical protein
VIIRNRRLHCVKTSETPGSDAARRTAGYNPMAQSRVYIGLPEERRADSEKIILQNARHDDLRHNCRVSSVPWWARHSS